MNLTVYVTLLMGATILCMATGVYANRKRPAKGAWELLLLMLAMGIWSFTSVFEALARSVEGKVLWSVLSYLGSQTVAPLLFLFVYRISSKKESIGKKWLPFLFLIPAFSFLLAATNHHHQLLWAQISLEPVSGGIAAVYGRGDLYWINIVYAYSLIIFSIILLFRFVFSSRGLFSVQSLLIIGACSIAFLTSVPYAINNRIIGGFDPTPLSFALTNALIGLAILRFGFLKISPIAWEQVAMNLQDGLLVLDKNDRVVEWNSTIEQWLEKNVLRVGSDAKLLLSKWPDVIDLGRPGHQATTEIHHPHLGQTFHVNATALKDRQNHFIGRALLFHDVTTLKKTQENLEKARREAQRANQAKSDFLAMISHEIRNPLHAITGLLYLLEDRLTHQDQKEYMDRIQSGVTTLSTIINDILDSSKIEAGKMELEEVPFHLVSLVENTVGMFEPSARKKGIRLILEPPGEYSRVYLGDPLRIQQILSNLISNAIKFTTHGHVQIRFESFTQAIRITVEDTGMGMSSQQLQQLFTPYTQAERSTSRLHGGTGLGLSICKSLSQAMGGTIHVTSEEGKGSFFVVELPLKVADAVALPSEMLKEEKKMSREFLSPDPVFESKHLLLIEDDPANAMLVQELLEKKGVRVDVAQDGKEGIELASSKTYDLVITDFYLPDMTGSELADKLKDISGFTTQIISLTGSTREEDKPSLDQSNIALFLRKPLPPKKLFDALRMIWGQHESLPHIDLTQGLEMTGGDREVFRQVLGIFLASLKEDWMKFRTDENRDAGLSKIIHKTKGSAHSVGAIKLAKACEAMEQELHKAGSLYPKESEIMARLEAEIMAIVDNHVLRKFVDGGDQENHR